MRLMFNLKYIVVILLIFLLNSLTAANEPIAIVIKAKGKVFLVHQGSKKGKPVRRGTRIYHNQSILTKQKSFAIIKYIDNGGVVRIQANSFCRFEGKKQKNSLFKNLYLEVGSIFNRVFKEKGEFRVTTPTSVASVKGTKFWVKQEFKGATYYFGEEGIVEISNGRGVALLKAGMTGIVNSPNSKPIVRKTHSGEKPQLKEDQRPDEFRLEFEDARGNTKTIKFKIRKENE
ncbi:FecR family protein [Calditrichota bacterium GD2]